MTPSVQIEKVSYCYTGSSIQALTDCSFVIPQGSLYAVLGPNGAGKTTLLRILASKYQPTSGQVSFPFDWVNSLGQIHPLYYGILIENPGVYRRLTAREYLRFFGSFYSILDLESRMVQDCQRLGLADLDCHLDKLSLGNRQKVQIVRALLHRPRLALLDEPVSNLDPMSRETVWQWLRELTTQEGITVVVCSHVLDEISKVCDSAAIIKQGHVLMAGALSDLLAQHTHSIQVDIMGWSPQQQIVVLESLKALQPEHLVPERVRRLVEQGAQITEVKVERPGLADIFKMWMGDSHD